MTYMVFAVVLNSVGTVILQSINSFGVSKAQASVLEAFKDLPIAGISLLLASSLPTFGYRRAILVGLGLVALGALVMIFGSAFWATKVFFLLSGLGFGIAKVAVYASIGLLATSTQRHASILNVIEGLFMVGVLSGYFIFAGFIDAANEQGLGWLNAYWVILALVGVSALVVASAPLAPPGIFAAQTDGAKPTRLVEEFARMLKLLAFPLTLVFIVSIFLYVLIEQGAGTWLPTFNREVLGLSAPMSVQAASIFAGGLALGRLSAGFVLRMLRWDVLLVVCLLAMSALILLTLPLAPGGSAGNQAPVTLWRDAPLAAFLIPLIGVFMAPIYPALNSFILSSLSPNQQAGMTGLIVVFSALGGTTGSVITGAVFERFDGQTAFYLTLVPIALILVSLLVLKRLQDNRHE